MGDIKGHGGHRHTGNIRGHGGLTGTWGTWGTQAQGARQGDIGGHSHMGSTDTRGTSKDIRGHGSIRGRGSHGDRPSGAGGTRGAPEPARGRGPVLVTPPVALAPPPTWQRTGKARAFPPHRRLSSGWLPALPRPLPRRPISVGNALLLAHSPGFYWPKPTAGRGGSASGRKRGAHVVPAGSRRGVPGRAEPNGAEPNERGPNRADPGRTRQPWTRCGHSSWRPSWRLT